MISKAIKTNTARFILSIFCAAMPLFAKAERGFWALDQVAGAFAFQPATNSVFMVTVPAGDKVIVDLKRYSTIQLALESFKDNSSLSEAERLIRKRQIDACIRERLTSCILLSSFELGTAFLIQNNKTIVSAFHVFRDQVNTSSGNVLPIVFQDRSGEIIFGARDEDKAEMHFAHSKALESKAKTSPFFDFIQLQLSRPLEAFKPLTVGNDLSLKVGDSVVQIGFPGPTYDRKTTHSKPDSDGINQFLTYGPLIDYSEYLRRTGKDIKSINPDILKLLTAATMYSDSDSYFGMSGAPTFNSRGEVVGMVIGSFPVDGSASKETSVGILRASWILGLKNLK